MSWSRIFAPGCFSAMGFDAAHLAALNPALVYCNLTGFGTGTLPRSPVLRFRGPGNERLHERYRRPDGAPMRAGPPIADLVAGLYGALGVCAALVRRGRTGRGETVGANLNNGMISVLGFLVGNYFATGEPPLRAGNDHAIV